MQIRLEHPRRTVHLEVESVEKLRDLGVLLLDGTRCWVLVTSEVMARLEGTVVPLAAADERTVLVAAGAGSTGDGVLASQG